MGCVVTGGCRPSDMEDLRLRVILEHERGRLILSKKRSDRCSWFNLWPFSSPCRNQASSLALLIAQMQKNADQVEKDILRSEEMLAVVRTHNTLKHKLMHSWCITFTDALSLKEITQTSVFFPQDAENEKKELPFEHQNEISEKLGEAEGLLKDLFLDVDKAKKLKHPQATEIESEWVVTHCHTFYCTSSVNTKQRKYSRAPQWREVF